MKALLAFLTVIVLVVTLAGSAHASVFLWTAAMSADLASQFGLSALPISPGNFQSSPSAPRMSASTGLTLSSRRCLMTRQVASSK